MNGRLWGHLSSGDGCRVRARDAGAPRARRGTMPSDAKRARNRRLAHMRRTLDRDGYFDVDAMRARAPVGRRGRTQLRARRAPARRIAAS